MKHDIGIAAEPISLSVIAMARLTESRISPRCREVPASGSSRGTGRAKRTARGRDSTGWQQDVRDRVRDVLVEENAEMIKTPSDLTPGAHLSTVDTWNLCRLGHSLCFPFKFCLDNDDCCTCPVCHQVNGGRMHPPTRRHL